MNFTKLLKGTIAGGVVAYFLGWVLYGMLLNDYSAENMNQCMNRPMDEMLMVPMILANLCYGLLIAIIWDWAGVSNWMDGLKKGAVFGLVMGLTGNLFSHSLTTAFTNTTAMAVDALASAVMAAVLGAVVAWAMNMGSKS